MHVGRFHFYNNSLISLQVWHDVLCYFRSSFAFVSVPYCEMRTTELTKPQHFYFSFTVEKYCTKTGDENYLLTGSRFLGFCNFFLRKGRGGSLHIVCCVALHD